jgi:maleylpyruvate isomerase
VSPLPKRYEGPKRSRLPIQRREQRPYFLEIERVKAFGEPAVPRVRQYLTDVLKVSDDQRLAWIQHWLGAGLQAIETLLAEHPTSGRFCHGESPTVADICLVTQVTPAMTFNLSLDPYPRVMRVYNTCMAISAFVDAHPSKQPDAE